ncbi:hypothetical protein Tco_0849931 [Tanacetum coccineum]
MGSSSTSRLASSAVTDPSLVAALLSKFTQMDRPGDVVFRIHYNGVFKYDPLRYEQFRVVKMQACITYKVIFSHLLDMLVAKVKDNMLALFFCIPGLDIDISGLKLIENDADVHDLKIYAGNMSIEELVAWAEEEASSPYSRSPPLKSRPFRNDIKGRVLFTNMYCVEDEGFEMYPPLNEDKVGKDDLLVWCSNLENDAAKILEGMSEGKNDASKSVEFNEGVHVSIDGMSEGMNDDANIDIDEQVLSKQQLLDKGKSLMTDEDIVTTKKRKIVSRGNGISIRENDSVNVVSMDNESDSNNHGDHQSKTDNDESEKSFDDLSNGKDVVIEHRKRRIRFNYNGAEVADDDHHEVGDEERATVDVDKYREIDDNGLGLAPLIREHEKYMQALARKLKGNGMGITDPFAIVEDSKEIYPIYDLTH